MSPADPTADRPVSAAPSPTAVADAYAAAWNEADAEALGALFAEDADFVSVVGVGWTRRRQIRVHHARAFRWMFPDSRLEFGQVRVRDLGDVATVHAPWTLTGPDADGDDADPRTGILLFVVQRTAAGTWEVVAAQNTERAPEDPTHLTDEDDGLAAVHYHPSAWAGFDDDPDDDGPEAC